MKWAFDEVEVRASEKLCAGAFNGVSMKSYAQSTCPSSWWQKWKKRHQQQHECHWKSTKTEELTENCSNVCKAITIFFKNIINGKIWCTKISFDGSRERSSYRIICIDNIAALLVQKFPKFPLKKIVQQIQKSYIILWSERKSACEININTVLAGKLKST